MRALLGCGFFERRMDYKSTLNLPQTDFPMKADLVVREPQRLAKWQKAGLYERIQAQRAQAARFVLHDGPPFANGDIHIGHALNKILKDIVIRYKSLRGFNAPYIPGWPVTRHPTPPRFGSAVKPTHANTSTSSAPNSSGWVCWAIGTILT